MPHHKSAIKRMRTNEKRRVKNARERSEMRSAIKRVRGAASREEGEQALRQAASVLDRAAKKGVIKRGTADRQKSRLTHHLQQISA